MSAQPITLLAVDRVQNSGSRGMVVACTNTCSTCLHGYKAPGIVTCMMFACCPCLCSLPAQATTKEGAANKLLCRIKLSRAVMPGNLDALLHLCAVGSPSLGKLHPPPGTAGAGGPKLLEGSQAGTRKAGFNAAAQRSIKVPGGDTDEDEVREPPRGSGTGARGLRFEGDSDGGAAEGGRQGEDHARSPRHLLSPRKDAQWEQLKSPKVSGAGAALRGSGSGAGLRNAALHDDDAPAASFAPGKTRFGLGPGAGRGAPQLAPSAPGSDDDSDDAGAHGGGGAPLLLGPGPDGPDPPQDQLVIADGASDIGSEEEGKLTMGSASEAASEMDEDVTCDWR